MASAVIIHEEFNPENLYNDIAIVSLADDPLSLNSKPSKTSRRIFGLQIIFTFHRQNRRYPSDGQGALSRRNGHHCRLG